MSKPMSPGELVSLLRKVSLEHNPIRGCSNPNFRPVKYVDPVFDNRTCEVFSVKIRGFGYEDKLFHVCNEQRELLDSLYDRVIHWLENK